MNGVLGVDLGSGLVLSASTVDLSSKVLSCRGPRVRVPGQEDRYRAPAPLLEKNVDHTFNNSYSKSISLLKDVFSDRDSVK